MKNKIFLSLSLILAIIFTTVALLSVSASTEGDPLISLSYLEKIILPSFKDEILDEVDSKISDIEYSYENNDEYDGEDILNTFANGETKAENIDGQNTSSSYTLLELRCGQVVTADGICEFISRPGSKITVVSPFPAQGIADITNGNEILNDVEVPINAYCLIPRGGDGRGFKVQSENAYIMIRGEYTIG